jgi:hypothetical protein
MALKKSTKMCSIFDKDKRAMCESYIGHEEIPGHFTVLMGVAFPDKMPELFEIIKCGDNSQLSLEELEPTFLSWLPGTVASIQSYASAMRNNMKNVENQPKTITPSTPLRVDKIGRNDPCPCGSGAKYKKCCGK